MSAPEYRTVASRYAISLFRIVEEDVALLEKTHDELSVLIQALYPLDAFKLLAHPNALSRKQVLSILEKIQNHCKFSNYVFNMLIVLSHNKRLNILDVIVDEFNALYLEKECKVQATLSYIERPNSSYINTLKTAIEKATNKTLLLEEKIDEKLLGGIVLQLNTLRFDNSIFGKLEKLKRTIHTY